MGVRNYAALPYEYLEEMDALTDEEFGRLCRALLKYSDSNVPIALEGNERFYAKRVMSQEDRFQASYQEISEKRKASGQKGGRPKGTAEKQPEANESKTNQTKPNQSKQKQTEANESKTGDTNTNTNTDTNTPPTNVGRSNPPESPPKGAKPKQPKVQWAEFVTMTNAEHDKLLATYGPADTQRLIEILDNYKGSSGHKYQSDYRAILSWAVDRLKEEKARNQRQNAGNRGNSTSGNPFLGMLSDMEQDELNIVVEEGDT